MDKADIRITPGVFFIYRNTNIYSIPEKDGKMNI
jgi:hypothetical protein